jgi:hypothetical protein
LFHISEPPKSGDAVDGHEPRIRGWLEFREVNIRSGYGALAMSERRILGEQRAA